MPRLALLVVVLVVAMVVKVVALLVPCFRRQVTAGFVKQRVGEMVWRCRRRVPDGGSEMVPMVLLMRRIVVINTRGVEGVISPRHTREELGRSAKPAANSEEKGQQPHIS